MSDQSSKGEVKYSANSFRTVQIIELALSHSINFHSLDVWSPREVLCVDMSRYFYRELLLEDCHFCLPHHVSSHRYSVGLSNEKGKAERSPGLQVHRCYHLYISSITIMLMALVTFALGRFINVGNGIFVVGITLLTTTFLVLVYVPKVREYIAIFM